MTERRPLVWSIAGSDSGGGAGIQADLLTLHDLGVHGCTAITAITAQNSQGVEAVRAVEADLLAAQLDALAEDLPPAAIKIGLVGSTEQVRLLGERLPRWKRRWPGLAVVLDPVGVATSGDRLAEAELFRALTELLPLVDLITPNWPELAQLTGHRVADEAAAIRAAEALANATLSAVLAKGGHGPAAAERCRDHLISPVEHWVLDQPRVDTSHTHGTGCTLSSAWAAAWARDYDLADAVVLANAHVQAGLRRAYPTGTGAGSLARTGWPRPDAFARVSRAADPDISGFAPLDGRIGVYSVVDDPGLVEDLVAAGVSMVQLRVKSDDPAVLRPAIERAVTAGRRPGTRVFINDHWREAIELGAYGVHLGQEDLAEADLAAIRAAGLRLGVSTHGYAELRRAQALRPSYIALGHVFPTRTKTMPSRPQGLARLARYRELVGDGPPTLAIGGVKRHHFAALADAGVDGVALVTAVTEAPDPVAAWRELDNDWLALGRQEALV